MKLEQWSQLEKEKESQKMNREGTESKHSKIKTWIQTKRAFCAWTTEGRFASRSNLTIEMEM